MGKRAWLEELHGKAVEKLPEWVVGFMDSGMMDELTLAEAPLAWDRIRIRPRNLIDVSAVTTTTSVLGTEVATPILVAPTAMQKAMHTDGELAVAGAAIQAGSLYCLSFRSGTPMEDVDALGGLWWMQVSVLADREITADAVRRAAAAGARAIILSEDSLVEGARSVGPGRARLSLGNLTRPGANPEEVWPAERKVTQALDGMVDDIGWLAELSGLPVVVKGVVRGDEARRCVEAGASGVVVSNYGGRAFDGVISTAEALSDVVAGLEGTGAEVYVDGGIRRGSHVLRALAMGARAVFVGRPVLWGLAADGQDGARFVLDELTLELREAMTLAGAPSLAQVTSDLVALPGSWR